MIKHAVKAMKDPVQARDSDGDAKARVGRVLHDGRLGSPADRAGVEVRIAKAGDQRQPRGHLKPVADEHFDQAAGYGGRRRAEVLTVRRRNP